MTDLQTLNFTLGNKVGLDFAVKRLIETIYGWHEADVEWVLYNREGYVTDYVERTVLIPTNVVENADDFGIVKEWAISVKLGQNVIRK